MNWFVTVMCPCHRGLGGTVPPHVHGDSTHLPIRLSAGGSSLPGCLPSLCESEKGTREGSTAERTWHPEKTVIAVAGTTRTPRYDDFSSYVAERGPALLRMARSLTNSHADAEDLLQAALVKTFLSWDRIADPRARDGYVRRAMVNTQISEWRRRRLDIYPTDEIPEQGVDDPTWRSDLADVVRRAIEHLPDRQRTTVILRYYDDLTEAQIAERMGVTIGTVKSTLSRATEKLRSNADLIIERTTC